MFFAMFAIAFSLALLSIDYIHELFKYSSICPLSKLPVQVEIRGQFNHSNVKQVKSFQCGSKPSFLLCKLYPQSMSTLN